MNRTKKNEPKIRSKNNSIKMVQFEFYRSHNYYSGPIKTWFNVVQCTVNNNNTTNYKIESETTAIAHTKPFYVVFFQRIQNANTMSFDLFVRWTEFSLAVHSVDFVGSFSLRQVFFFAFHVLHLHRLAKQYLVASLRIIEESRSWQFKANNRLWIMSPSMVTSFSCRAQKFSLLPTAALPANDHNLANFSFVFTSCKCQRPDAWQK